MSFICYAIQCFIDALNGRDYGAKDLPKGKP